jgi:hypothetical protein
MNCCQNSEEYFLPKPKLIIMQVSVLPEESLEMKVDTDSEFVVRYQLILKVQVIFPNVSDLIPSCLSSIFLLT